VTEVGMTSERRIYNIVRYIEWLDITTRYLGEVETSSSIIYA
jgi:hypothetical protein